MKLTKVISNYFATTISEMRKVNWPSRQKTINDSLLVIIAVIIAAVIFGLIDLGLSQLLSILIQKGR